MIHTNRFLFATALLSLVGIGFAGCADRDSAAPDALAGPGRTSDPASEEGSIALLRETVSGGRWIGGNHTPVPLVPGQCAVQIAADETEASINAKYDTKTLLHIEDSEFIVLSFAVTRDPWTLCDLLVDSGDCLVAEPIYVTEAPEGNQGTIPFYEGGHDALSVLSQDAFVRIGVEAAQGVSRGKGILVAILDTGVDATHPDFGSSVTPNGFDFYDGDPFPDDSVDGIDQDRDGLVDEGAGHGTHVAGILHAIAPDAQILPVRVLGTEGRGTTVAVARGIRYAVQRGARVINLSLGLHYSPLLMKEAIDLARARGVLVVVSAGNGGVNDYYYFPAKHPDVMAIASTTSTDEKASFSNYGSHIALSAPGEDILAPALDHSYAYWSGTSMSAPMVAAAAALRLEKSPWLDVGELEAVIEDTSAPLDFEGFPYDGKMGAGRLDLPALLAD